MTPSQREPRSKPSLAARKRSRRITTDGGNPQRPPMDDSPDPAPTRRRLRIGQTGERSEGAHDMTHAIRKDGRSRRRCGVSTWTCSDLSTRRLALTGTASNEVMAHLWCWCHLAKAIAHRSSRWRRRYVAGELPRPHSPEDLAGKPVTWTIGGLNPAGMFFDNVVLAVKSGCPISLLNCKHFPQVSAAGMLAEHIRVSTQPKENDESH